MQKIFITTLGCRVNQADSAVLAANLIAAGNEIVKKPEYADICILNTCTVTAKADMECRRMARRLRAQNPKAKIVLTGCYVNVSAEELKKMTEVEVLTIADLVSCFMPRASAGGSTKHETGSMITSRARPYLKIQDGCNNFCTYCIVPYARGRSRSVPPEDVIARVEALATAGYQEVVLTGIHLGGYGKDLLPKTSLLELLKMLTIEPSNHPAIARVRLSSIDPDEWTGELIDLIAENKSICRHFHIPLQSGSDEILQKMGRRYDTKYYSNLVLKLRDNIPDSAIGADVIVGFPGETSALFQKTVEFIEYLPLTYLHVFPYSKRRLTAASKFEETAANAEKERRAKILRAISSVKREKFYASFIGSNLDVVVENKRDKKTLKLKGISSNYVPVVFDGHDGMFKKLIKVKVINAEGQMSYGRIE